MEKFEAIKPEEVIAEKLEQEKKEILIEPEQEISPQELEQLKEDIATTPHIKGWTQYWIGRLLPEADKLPPVIKATITRGRIKPSTQGFFVEFVKQRINKTAQKLVGLKLKAEQDPVLENKQNDLLETLKTFWQENQEISKNEKLPLVSQQEENDLKMTRPNAAFIRYWANRLLPELDILPIPAQEAIRQYIQEKKLSGNARSVFHKYINKRITVLSCNVKKRLEMAKLKQNLKNIDEKKDYQERDRAKRRIIFYDEQNNQLFIRENEIKKPITFGDVIVDYDYGIEYSPDDSVPEKYWRKIRKLADLTAARRNIEKIFNRELSEIESLPLATTNLPEKYLEHHIYAKSSGMEGIIAERMVKNFLTRAQHNNPELGLKVEPSNVLEDIDLKYDFKIIIPEKRRGVAMVGEDITRNEFINQKRKIGIQFTVGKAVGKKQSQITEAKSKVAKGKYLKYAIKPVDDIVLLQLRLGTFQDHFKQWLKAGKPSGGPEQYLTREEKIRIFKEATRDFLDLSDEQIGKLAF